MHINIILLYKKRSVFTKRKNVISKCLIRVIIVLTVEQKDYYSAFNYTKTHALSADMRVRNDCLRAKQLQSKQTI